LQPQVHIRTQNPHRALSELTRIAVQTKSIIHFPEKTCLPSAQVVICSLIISIHLSEHLDLIAVLVKALTTEPPPQLGQDIASTVLLHNFQLSAAIGPFIETVLQEATHADI